jgi:hypothetical protein
VISEFFCLSCSRTVYSHPDQTCPVCSSPLLEIQAPMSDPELDEIVVVLDEDAPNPDPDDHEPPAEPAVLDRPLD